MLQWVLDGLQSALTIELQSMRLTADQIARTMRDFMAGRRLIWIYCQVKFGFWNQLPWHYFGMGALRLDVARACCRRCLLLRGSEPLRLGEHWLVGLMSIKHRGELQRLAVEFEDLDSLPFLKRMCGRFRFTITSERWVESIHAIAKHLFSSAHHVGPVHIALHSCLQAIRDYIRDEPDALRCLSVACYKVRNPSRALKEMELLNHPSSQRLLGNSQRVNQYGHMNRKHVHEITEILYHVDARSLNQWQPNSLGFLPPPGGDGGDDDNPPGLPPPSGLS